MQRAALRALSIVLLGTLAFRAWGHPDDSPAASPSPLPSEGGPASALKLRVDRQGIERSGPHPFRSVDFTLTNAGTRPIHVFGDRRGDHFEPAGDCLTLDERTQRWSPPHQELTPQTVKAEYPQTHVLRPGESLAFGRTYSPSYANRTVRADVYASWQASGTPVLVTTEPFLLR
jgi:hypothetical protein